MKAANVPAAVSNTAGTYVCNHLMYGVCYYIKKEFPKAIGGFMHVPFLHEQVMNKKETASLSKDDVVKGIEASIEAIVDSLNWLFDAKDSLYLRRVFFYALFVLNVSFL